MKELNKMLEKYTGGHSSNAFVEFHPKGRSDQRENLCIGLAYALTMYISAELQCLLLLQQMQKAIDVIKNFYPGPVKPFLACYKNCY